MRRSTIYYTMYMTLSALGVLALGIYTRNSLVILGSLGLLVLCLVFYFVEKRSQTKHLK